MYETQPITVEDSIVWPPPGLSHPQCFAFNHDGRYLACLWSKSGGRVRDLWLYDTNNGSFDCVLSGKDALASEADLNTEEALSRERSRERWLGVTSFSWSPVTNVILTYTGRCINILHIANGRRFTYEHPDSVFFPSFSPNGRRIVFHSQYELWCLNVNPDSIGFSDLRRLTQDGSAICINGLSDQVTWEEIYSGMALCWSNDSKAIIFASFHLDGISKIRVQDGFQRHEETHLYPFPGAENVPKFSLSIAEIDAQKRIQLLAPNQEWPYLASVSSQQNARVVVTRVSRNQRKIELLSIDLDDGSKMTTLIEECRPWVNILAGPVFLKSDNSFLWLHQRKGLIQIARHRFSGELISNIAVPSESICEILDIDEENGYVYYVASDNDPRERQIFRSKINGESQFEQLTQNPGTHSASLDSKRHRWVRTSESITCPPEVVFESIAGERYFRFPEFFCDKTRALSKRSPDLISFSSNDAKEILYGAVYQPSRLEKNRRYPVILLVYGGPHMQAVRNCWNLTVDMRAQFWTDQGFLVLKVDNRGSSGRGLEFEAPLHCRFGEIEIADQIAGVNYVIASYPIANSSRVGVYGWSYGGYLSLLCLLTHPELFIAGVAGAPVTDWQDYNALYTERYMGVPNTQLAHLDAIENIQGYQCSSVLSRVAQLSAELMIIHGMKDENVLIRHTMQLLQEAAEAGKNIDLLLMPNERHSVRNIKMRRYIEGRILSFFSRHLIEN